MKSAARCKRFGDVEIKDNIRCKECVDYEREVLEDSFRI